jgi:hypothetical protein
VHFVEQVEVVVAGGAVGAQGDIDARCAQCRNGAGTGGELHVRLRAVHDVGAGLGEAGDVLGAEIRHVHALRARPEEADATQGVNGAFAVGLHRLQYLALGFVQVNLYAMSSSAA